MYIYEKIEPLKVEKCKQYLSVKKDKMPLVNIVLGTLHIAPIMAEYSRPIMLLCETTNICTNNCIICAYGKMKREKMTMPLKLFEKVLRDYSEIGGGFLSLTPKAGDVFCDNLLPMRLALIKKYPAIKALSMTTNAVLADMYDDGELANILACFKRVQISVYGMDEDEYKLMTGTDYYSRVVDNIGRILRLTNSDCTNVVLAFRLLKTHTEEDIKNWIRGHFNADIPYSYTYTYMDWNGTLDDRKPLPYDGRWRDRIVNHTPCLLPIVTGVVFSNGDVSLCPCNDFDIRDEFKLGNVAKSSLTKMFNSKKAIDFWDLNPGNAQICEHCGSHRSFLELSKYEYMFEDPIRFIGG